MNKAMAIAARQLNGRRSIFLTAAVVAAIPYAVLLMPEIERYGHRRQHEAADAVRQS